VNSILNNDELYTYFKTGVHRYG